MKSSPAERRRGSLPLELDAPLERVTGIGPRRAAAFAALEIAKVEDLLRLLPLRYEDRRRFARAADLVEGDRVVVSGRVRKVRLRRTRIRGFTLFDAEVEDASGTLPCVWYNQPYLARVIREGQSLVLFGLAERPERGPGRLIFRNPQYEVVGDDPEGIHMGRIVPVYRRTADLSTRGLRTLLHRVLGALPAELPDPLPASLAKRLGLPGRRQAFRHIHFPPEDLSPALLESRLTPSHRRLALEELYALQLTMARSRDSRKSISALCCPRSPEGDEALAALAPFRLTGSQSRVLDELLSDLARSHPMSRLLQGEVGCGKTVVAALAAVRVMETGGQVAWMVPTELLAEQHAATLSRFLSGASARIEVLTGERSRSRNRSGPAMVSGEVGLVVGTQALIQRRVRFHRLALVIIDEQHRFGVRQRTSLGEKGEGPHLLMMTATPIPRSMALACYGDLDISRIDELPPGRAPVRTYVRRAADRERVFRFIHREVARGGRGLIVYPGLVERTPGEGRLSAIRAFQRLAAGPLAGVRLGLVHGRLPADERRRVMADFVTGAVEVLIATSVIEVGIDVPQATVMVIEAADRFGLAQLHQMRGRVGRGSREGYCILIPDEDAAGTAIERLTLLTRISSGYEVAEKDLETRGPGEFGGHRQSGDPEFRIAELTRDGDLLEIAREAVRTFC